MCSFHFPACGELVRAIRYLACFDDNIKFSVSIETDQSLLRLCTASVPPYSYTEVVYDNAKSSKPFSCALATEEETLVPVSTTEYRQTWVIHAGLLQSVLATFDEAELLAIEFVEGASQMLLYQRDECQRRTRVAQIDVLQYLGPSLLVQHDVTLFYRIRDTTGFRQMCRAICCDDEGGCTVALQRGEGDTCDLTFSTAAVRSSVQLGYVDVPLAPTPSGSARCADLEAFGSLCRLATRDALLQLSVGFGQNGVALFRLQWTSPLGPRTATLFFCASV